MKGVNTSIVHATTSSDGNVEEDGIHLKYGISQEVWDRESIPTHAIKSPV